MADVSKALNIVRKLNPMGFFSRATEEAQRLPQAKGTGEQMRAMLLKQGVKPDELKWTGFDDWAKGKKSVTRDEITEFLRRNEVQLGEKRLGGANPYPYTTGDEWQRAINRAERQGNYDEAERLTLAWEAREGVGPGGAAKFEKYTLPGGKDYSELLLTRPTPPAYSVKPTENGNFILIDNATGEPAKTPNGQMVPPFSSERQANDIAQTYSRAIGDEKMRETGYRSSHWDDPNVLAHMRMSGRTDPEGRRVLHLEELQSDWAQEGRKKGFDTPERTQKVAALKEEERRLQNYYNDLQQQKSRLQPTGGFVGEPIEYPEGYNETIARLTQEMRNTQSEISAIRQNMPGTATPNAPFVESTPGWTNLALKRAMIEAARGNYDAIAWTPGAEQAKRFDLSKQIDDIRYAPSTDGRTVSLEAYRGGENIFNQTNMPIAKLDEFVGRDVAERIAKGVGETDPNTGYRVLSGLDLQVGGEGMKGYYDKILPTQIGKVLKDINETPQFGTVNVPTPTRDARYHRLDDAELMAELRQNGDPPQSMTLPSINLTPQMREKINQGLPLFTMMPAAVGLGATASQMQEGQNPAVEEPREGFEFGGPVDMRAGEMIGLRARLGLSPKKINDRAGPIHTDPAVAAARDAAAAEENPAVVEQALDVVRSQPRQPVAARPLTIPAPRSAPPEPSESQRLWQLYNESENPADFVRADEAMRAGRADGGKIVRKALDFLRANPELKPYKGGSFSLERQGVYNPKFFDLKKDDLIDDAGNIIASKNVTIPREGFSYNLPAQADPDKIFRGMSAEEFANFQKNNYLKSFGTHNIGDAQEGLTYFSVNPDEARSYAHSFAPSEFKPDPSRPAYVMAVKRPPEDRVSRVPGTGESEVGVTGQIPREDVTNVYRGNVVDYIEGIDEPGAKVSPTSSVYWEEIADYAKGGHVERADGGRLLEDQYPSQYLPDVGRQVMQDGGAPNNDAYLDALLAAHSDPNADIRDYQRSMGQIAQQPEDVRSMTHAPSKPMRPIEIEGGFIGKRQLGQAPYDVAGPLSGMAQTAYSLKTLPFYFTPAAPFAAASDFGEAVIDTKSALDKGDYLGAGFTGALGVALPAAAYRKQIGNALSTARDVLGRAPVAAGAAAGAAAMTPEEAQAGKADAITQGLEKAIGIVRKASAAPDLRASTRFPTGAKASEDPLKQQLTIGPAEMKASPGFGHNMGLLAEYPGFSHLKGMSPEDQLSAYIEQARGNLNFLYEKAPEIMRQRSPVWYEGANNFSDALASRYGIPRQSSSAAIAALSPQMDWFKNASLAERVGDVIFSPTASSRMTPEMEAFQKASPALTSGANQLVFDTIRGKKFSDLTDPLDQALWIRLYDEAHNPRNYRSLSPEGNLGDYIKSGSGEPAKIGWGSLNEIAKAVRAYTSGGDMNVISPMLGTKHKVRSFYNNIELPGDQRFGDVTADTHAVAASQLRPLSGNTPAVAHNLASGLAKNKQPPGYQSEKSSSITGVQGTYGANAEATRLAAADQGLLPREMQSATWEPVRELFPAKWKTPRNIDAVDNIWRQKDAGNITAEQARKAILDLAGGFSEPSWAERGFTAVDPRRASTYR